MTTPPAQAARRRRQMASAEPAGQTSRQTPTPEAAKAAVSPTTGPDHRQADQLWGCEEGDHARCWAPAAQGLE